MMFSWAGQCRGTKAVGQTASTLRSGKVGIGQVLGAGISCNDFLRSQANSVTAPGKATQPLSSVWPPLLMTRLPK